MKKIIPLFIFLTLITFSKAQTKVLSFAPTTGDKELNAVLTEENNKAVKDISIFKKDIKTNFNIEEKKIEELLLKLAPADILMAVQVSVAVNKSFDEVVTKYEANKAKGWGVIAKELGIKPGSPEFHSMKQAMKDRAKKNEKAGKGNSGKGNSGNGNSGKGKKK